MRSVFAVFPVFFTRIPGPIALGVSGVIGLLGLTPACMLR